MNWSMPCFLAINKNNYELILIYTYLIGKAKLFLALPNYIEAFLFKNQPCAESCH